MTTTCTRTSTLAVALVLLGLTAGSAAAQSVTERTPNLAGVWSAPRGVVQFNFLHRFSMSDPPLRKVTNTPTFNVGTGLSERVMIGFVYGSNSALVPAYPNEWEFYARATPLLQSAGAPLGVSVQGGYNVASQSLDGELLVAREAGPARVFAAGRAFSEGYATSDARFAVAGGLALALSPRISLAGDIGTLTDRRDSEPWVWGVGLQMGVPYTPHSFSIHATNVGTGSLEGASRGTRTRWGFEYTVPITIARLRAPSGAEVSGGGAPGLASAFQNAQPSGDTVFVDVQNLGYSVSDITVSPGTTVVWTNRDPFAHSITSDDGQFDSGLFESGASYALTFPVTGTFPFHCTPHPWMTGRVVVSGGDDRPRGDTR